MQNAAPAPGMLRRGVMRVIDGAHVWGTTDVRSDRNGVLRCRLLVYPPGISDSERRRLRAARGWPLWGVVVWVAFDIWFSYQTTPLMAIALATAVTLAAGLVATAVAGDLRSEVRTMHAIVTSSDGARRAGAGFDRFEALAAALTDADDRLRTGQFSAADHERVWWRVYNQINRGRNVISG